MEYFTKQNIMLAILGLSSLSIVFAFWRAHKLRNDFDIVDLVMEDGKISPTRVAFMITLFVSCWVIIDKQRVHELDMGTFNLWVTVWIIPLVAVVVLKQTNLKMGGGSQPDTAGKSD